MKALNLPFGVSLTIRLLREDAMLKLSAIPAAAS
jgi:hypothetical protein